MSYNFGEPFNLENHPVVGFSWYEALAFSRWLNDQMRARLPKGYAIQLPSEAEWEKAARGGLKIPVDPKYSIIKNWEWKELQVESKENDRVKRSYPWGDAPDPNRANYYDTQIGSTSAVGCFPSGASPYGTQDMSGNVWEWTRSVYKDYPYNPKDNRKNLKADKDTPRVLRGGSFDYLARNVRCAYRDWFNPDFRVDNLGFRVVLSPL